MECTQHYSAVPAVRAMHATLVRATTRSHRSRYRFGPIQVAPALGPSEPRRPPRLKQAVPYGARSATRPLSTSSSEPRSPQIRCVRKYNARLNVHFQGKTTFEHLGHISSCAKQRSSSRPSRSFARAWTRAARCGARRLVSPCVRPSPHTHGEIRGRSRTFPARRIQPKFPHQLQVIADNGGDIQQHYCYNVLN